jgi:uncharacterized protein (UPF0276 family)
VAHARLAADLLGLDAREYIARLPLARTHEIHLAGIQPFSGRWQALLDSSGLSQEELGWFAGLAPGALLDHLPLTDEDWAFYAWALEQVHGGAWGQPWIATLEYGGVGAIWELLTEQSALAEQVPRLYALVKNHASA